MIDVNCYLGAFYNEGLTNSDLCIMAGLIKVTSLVPEFQELINFLKFQSILKVWLFQLGV
jgi:hypothetical protein